MCLHHPKTMPTSQSVEKLFSTNLVPGTKNVGDHCFRVFLYCKSYEVELLV